MLIHGSYCNCAINQQAFLGKCVIQVCHKISQYNKTGTGLNYSAVFRHPSPFLSLFSCNVESISGGWVYSVKYDDGRYPLLVDQSFLLHVVFFLVDEINRIWNYLPKVIEMSCRLLSWRSTALLNVVMFMIRKSRFVSTFTMTIIPLCGGYPLRSDSRGPVFRYFHYFLRLSV